MIKRGLAPAGAATGSNAPTLMQQQMEKRGLTQGSNTQRTISAKDAPASPPGVMASVADFFTGDSEKVGDFPEYAAAPELNQLSMDSLSLAAKTLWESDPEARAEIMKNNVKGSDTAKDAKGNDYWIDPNGKPYIMDDPGLTANDFMRFTAETLKFLPAGRVAVGTKAALGAGKLATTASAGAGALAAGTTELLSDATSRGFFGREKDVDPTEALGAAIGGGVGELLAPVAGKLAKTFGPRFQGVLQFLSRTKLQNEDGSLTAPVIDILQKAGIDPAELTQNTQQKVAANIEAAGIAAGDLMRKGAVGNAERTRAAMTAADAVASDLLPNTRPFKAEAANDLNELANLYRTRQEGVRGGEASQVVREAFDDRAKNLAGDLENFGDTFASQGKFLASEQEAGEYLNDSILDAGSQKLAQYRELRNQVPARTYYLEGQQLPKIMERTARGSGVDDRLLLSPDTTPEAIAILKKVQDFFTPAKGVVGQAQARIKGLNQTAIEDFRQTIEAAIGRAKTASMGGGNNKDVKALTRMKHSIDDWQDDVVERQMVDIKTGDVTGAQGVQMIKDSRRLFREYAKLFRKNTRTASSDERAVSGTIANAGKEDVSGLETIEGILGTGNSFGSLRRSSVAAERVKRIFGEDSPQFQLLQQAAWRRLIAPAIKNGTGKPEALSRRIDEVFKGEKSKALLDVLYPTEKQAQIREIKKLADIISRRDIVFNGPGTAATLISYLKDAVNGFALPVVAGGAFGPGGFVLGRAVTKIAGQANVKGQVDRSVAERMVAPIEQQLKQRTGLPVAIGANALSGSDTAERANGVGNALFEQF